MNLFWKIFITFGIAMTLTLVGAVFVSFRLAGLAFDQMNIENRESILERADDALATGGRDGLQRWLRGNPSPTPGVILMILDPQGEDLLDREVPPPYANLLRAGSVQRYRQNPRGFSNVRPPQFTTNLVGEDGTEYRLLFVRTAVTVLGVLTWPATQVAVLTLSILAAAATSLMLARYLSSPIVRLQRASRALAAGALDARVGGPFDRRKDEVGTLARDFDAMAERIQALISDKDTLLRDVSHELRSPLARIRVALALAQRKAGAASLNDLERIEQETERLDGLVGQILTLARLRSPLTGHDERVRLDELVNDVVADARFEQPAATIKLDVDTAGSPPFVRGDRAELASAVENVIRNALVYSNGRGNVRVKLTRRAQQQLAVMIADSGPGVPEQDLQRIFEPFYRVDQSRDHRGGYGLGLAIAASVLDRHHGKIRAANGAGGGLEVTLMLPADAG